MQEFTHLLFRLTFDDVVDNCGKTFTTRGRTYQRADRVLDMEWDPDQKILSGKVAGESALPYGQTIRAEETFIDGACSCPVGYNCKHVAAVLLAWIDKHAEHSLGFNGEQNLGPAGESQNIDREYTENVRLENWHEKLLRHSNNHQDDRDNDVFPGEELLLYQLDRGSQYNSQPGINVQIIKSRLLKKGGLGKESSYRYQSDYYPPRWMTPVDREILNIALACRDRFNYKPLSIEGNLGEPLLQKLVQSKRAYWGEQREHPLTFGQSQSLDLHWEVTGTPKQYQLNSTLSDNATEWELIPCEKPWYIDTNRHQVGPVSTGISGSLLHDLIKAPKLTPEQALETANFFALHMPEENIPLPVPATFESVTTKPIPVLLLRSLESGTDISNYYLSIHFLYAEYQLPFEGNDSAMIEKTGSEGQTIVVHRDLPEELNHIVFFNKHCSGFAPADQWDASQFTSADRMPRPDIDRRVAAEWRVLLDQLEAFEAAGWQIQRHESFDLTFDTDHNIEAAVSDGNNGWFDVAMTLQTDGQTFKLLPLVRDWLMMDQPDRSLMLQTETGRWIEVKPEVLEPVVSVLMELFSADRESDILRLPPQRANLISVLDDEFDENGIDIQWHGDLTLRKLSDSLTDVVELNAVEAPENLDATLRDYQCQGLAWLQFLSQHGFNGILADDMGLGKTLQALAHLLVEHNEGRLTHPALVIAPTSVLGNWRKEIRRFVPSLNEVVLHGPDRHEFFDDIKNSQVVITSYQILLRDIDKIGEMQFSHLILDEAQMIKNPQAKVTQALKTLKIEKKLCLTGTPMENHLGELWSLFDFLMPGFLGVRKEFSQRFRTPIEKHGNKEQQERLNKMISAFMLRRNKDQVASELPPKTTIIREVELGQNQTRLYESIRLSMEKHVRELISLKGMNRSHIEILDALLKLRQTCCHPKLVKLESASQVTESAKLNYLLEMVEELVAEDKKILLFSQFTSMLDLIAKELKAASIPFVTLTGSTRKRDQVIDQFQEGDIPVFLISLKAGGTGLNLTAADTVIHYDPWWNPAVENQASDRAHRIGQDKPVFVYKLVAKDTVEEKIVNLQKKKQQLADSTYNRDETADPFKQLSTEDILDLLA